MSFSRSLLGLLWEADRSSSSLGATVNKLMGKALCLSFIGAPIDLYVVIRLTFQAFGSRPYSGKHVLVGVGPIIPSI